LTTAVHVKYFLSTRKEATMAKDTTVESAGLVPLSASVWEHQKEWLTNRATKEDRSESSVLRRIIQGAMDAELRE